MSFLPITFDPLVRSTPNWFKRCVVLWPTLPIDIGCPRPPAERIQTGGVRGLDPLTTEYEPDVVKTDRDIGV